jgi:hypothetical protein
MFLEMYVQKYSSRKWLKENALPDFVGIYTECAFCRHSILGRDSTQEQSYVWLMISL